MTRPKSPIGTSSSSSSSSSRSCSSTCTSTTTTPLSVRVLRFFSESKESSSALKKTRFVYEIETCHQLTGDIYRAERRFREFKRLREGLLLECRDCPTCRPFVDSLAAAKLPPRALVVLDSQRYGETRARELTNFLTDLVELVARHARCCGRDGPDVDKSVGLFLGLTSLSEAEDVVTAALVGPLKTREDRIEYRAASMPDFRGSMSYLGAAAPPLAPGDDQRCRVRGFSNVELHR